MDWITEKVAVGNYLDAQDTELLAANSIVSIVCLDGCLAGRTPEALGVRRVEVIKLADTFGNDPNLFLRAVDRVIQLVDRSSPVLVHCHAGRSRSPVVVAGYLMRTRGIQPEEALKLVAAKRQIAVTPGVGELLWHLT